MTGLLLRLGAVTFVLAGLMVLVLFRNSDGPSAAVAFVAVQPPAISKPVIIAAPAKPEVPASSIASSQNQKTVAASQQASSRPSDTVLSFAPVTGGMTAGRVNEIIPLTRSASAVQDMASDLVMVEMPVADPRRAGGAGQP